MVSTFAQVTVNQQSLPRLSSSLGPYKVEGDHRDLLLSQFYRPTSLYIFPLLPRASTIHHHLVINKSLLYHHARGRTRVSRPITMHVCLHLHQTLLPLPCHRKPTCKSRPPLLIVKLHPYQSACTSQRRSSEELGSAGMLHKPEALTPLEEEGENDDVTVQSAKPLTTVLLPRELKHSNTDPCNLHITYIEKS